MTHPDYPSLLSLSESLLEWGIETKAVRGTINDLSEADYPGIACLKNNQYGVLESVNDKNVEKVPGKKKLKKLTILGF